MSLRGMTYLLVMMLIELILLVNQLVTAIDQPKSWCPKTCGNVNISFPFGTHPDCYLDKTFLITCNETYNPPKPFLRTSNIPVLKTSPDGTITVSSLLAYGCYNKTGRLVSEFTLSTFSISSTLNQFFVVGCDTVAYIYGLRTENDYTVGCISLCNGLDSVVNGSCSGIGCCQASIPKGVMGFQVRISSKLNYTRVDDFNPCGYAFVTENESFNFSTANLLEFRDQSVSTVLDYGVGNSTCEVAKQNKSSYACRSVDSECKNSTFGKGYFCKCLEGFEGNPYLEVGGGCVDINECEDQTKCKWECQNTPGNYSCVCPEGYKGDCYDTCQKVTRNTLLYIALGVISSLLLLLAGSAWIYHVSRERKLSQLREKFFHKNGGLMLQEKLSKQTGGTGRAIIFTEQDLKKATDNFSEATVIGKGGFGTVHKGVLFDKKIVAIKKSKVTDDSQNEQFINEVIILSEINHRHVVKLLGCCLETEVPLLVYEFITNGTLYSHIQDAHLSSKFTWDIRLKVAAETAGALAYLHSHASVPIIHRDVKSANILLDDTYSAKVADFGASRFIPLDKSQLTTLVQGTFGYLDPEYFHSGQLTAKSDVYSFGVVLAELLTGQEAASFNKSEEDRSLAMYFLSSISKNKLPEILDHRLGMSDRKIEQVEAVALLAKRCLNVTAKERPTMKEVALELEGLMVWQHHPWTENNFNPEETDFLIGSSGISSSSGNGLFGSSKGCNTKGVYDSMKDQNIVGINDGR